MRARLLSTLILASLACGALAMVFPKRASLAAVLWTLIMAAYFLLELNAHGRALLGGSSRFDQVLTVHGREPLIPEDLKRMERGLGWMSYEASYFDFRVRPILRELINHRARQRLDIDLSKNYERALGRIDDELLNLYGNKKAEALYGTRNITTQDLVRMVERIEAIE